ncbi:unnamed protein product [Nesidiocoris tenuis]|uniref:arylamine N-acetyltransferase n=1 Tax=Nesidiocoris tenuis TaxID=355587 RepID=A0A6H5GKE0_9HEMI|nr:unnamed protein product [Nesidiocoris tenuis]
MIVTTLKAISEERLNPHGTVTGGHEDSTIESSTASGSSRRWAWANQAIAFLSAARSGRTSRGGYAQYEPTARLSAAQRGGSVGATNSGRRCHLEHARYQNYDLLMDREPVDMSPSALMQRLLVDKRGGICYELCELFLHVLQLFKFDTLRVPVFNLVYGQVYDRSLTNNHNIVVVNLGGKKYLVDNTYGFNALREPLEFSFEEDEEKSIGPDKYRLECFDDHYKLSLWLKNAWAAMYRFDRPLAPMDWDESMDNIRRFLTSPETIPIRDSVLKIGIITHDDRIGFQCAFDPRSRRGNPPYTMVKENSKRKRDQVTYRDFYRSSRVGRTG